MNTSSAMPRHSMPTLVHGSTSPSVTTRETLCRCSAMAAPASAGVWTEMAMKSLAPRLHLAPPRPTVDHLQSPPRGLGQSVSAGGKACWNTTGAHPGTTSMCPSVTTWATSSPCSATGRVISVGVWTRMAENFQALAPSQAPCLHAYPPSPHPWSGPHPGLM